jgi:ComEC/Rec2-related protein
LKGLPAAGPRVWTTLGSLSAGIWIGWHASFPLFYPAGGLLLLVPLAIVVPPAKRIVLLVPGALLAGFLLASARASRQAALQDIAANWAECDMRGTVTESGGLGSFGRIDEARCEGFDAVTSPGTVVIEDELLRPGESFDGHGTLSPLSDDPFDVARRRIGADGIFFADRTRVERPRAASGAPFYFRESMTEAVSVLEPRAGALLLGLTIGETSQFDEQTLEEFRRSGLAHLLAVSGSNVAIVVGTVALCMARAAIYTRLLVCAGSLVFYVLVVGPDPSVVRAAAMGALGLAGMLWGHRPEPLSALALALIVALALRPAFLFSVGLHLSAAATAGLILWSRPFARRLGYKIPRMFAWPAGATLAAQIAVAPLLALTFGEISVTAPIANVIALPAVVPATIFGLGAAAAGLVSETAGTTVAAVASPLAAWIVGCADALGSPGWAQIQVPRWAGWAGLVLVSVAGIVTARRSLVVH